jgi:chloramphenicol O-acetyltransferase type A
MSLAVLAHHGLIDGYHMGLFVEELQKELNK